MGLLSKSSCKKNRSRNFKNIKNVFLSFLGFFSLTHSHLLTEIWSRPKRVFSVCASAIVAFVYPCPFFPRFQRIAFGRIAFDILGDIALGILFTRLMEGGYRISGSRQPSHQIQNAAWQGRLPLIVAALRTSGDLFNGF